MSGVEGLKPCPFCGGAVGELSDTRPGGSCWYECEVCRASDGGAYDTEPEAATGWNRRAPVEPSVPTEQADGGVGGRNRVGTPDWFVGHVAGMCASDDTDLEGLDVTRHDAAVLDGLIAWAREIQATPPATPIAGGFGSRPQEAVVPTERPETAVLVSLAECPPGLFWFGDTLGFKTEYGHSTGKDVGGGKVEWVITSYAEAYCVETGEYFWGGAPDLLAREELMVVPVSPGILRQQNEPKDAARRDEEAGQ